MGIGFPLEKTKEMEELVKELEVLSKWRQEAKNEFIKNFESKNKEKIKRLKNLKHNQMNIMVFPKEERNELEELSKWRQDAIDGFTKNFESKNKKKIKRLEELKDKKHYIHQKEKAEGMRKATRPAV